MELRWIASSSASYLHAARALSEGRSLADEGLGEALAKPARGLHREIVAGGLPEERFWRHLIALSARIENNRQLSETALFKTIGRSPGLETRAERLAARIADLEAAARDLTPGLVDNLERQGQPLREQWKIYGRGVLMRVARLTDDKVFPPAAEAVLVYPAVGGNGQAHLPYNLVRIEAVPADPIAELPEVLRLAWLVAQLNLDLPMFSEAIHADRLPYIAEFAMLPATLRAAEDLGLARFDPALFARAIDAWNLTAPPDAALDDILSSWWETYAASRPRWHVALAALDRMLG